MEWKFVIHHFYTTEIYADSTICYNTVYNTERNGINQAKVYIKENNLKCDLLIRMYRRKKILMIIGNYIVDIVYKPNPHFILKGK